MSINDNPEKTIMSEIVWKPSPEDITQSQMMSFLNYINQQQALSLEDYEDLYGWSIHHPELFWPAIWDFNAVIASKRWNKVLVHPEKMPGAQWFTDAQFNFAENLLRYKDEKIAIVFRNEIGQRSSITYAELYKAVGQLAAALRAEGVIANDRVAGYMPNIIETIIAMLATTSIGAIWSSCSQDFGATAALDRFIQIEPKVIFAADGYYYNGKILDSLEKIQQLNHQIPSLQKTIIIPYIQKNPDLSSLKNTVLYHDFLDSNPPELTFEQLAFNHPIYILYSSGTTGTPKCIVHGAGGVLLQHLKELKLHTDLTRDDVFFYFTNCGWMMWNWMVSGLAAGSTLIVYDGSPFYPKYRSLFDLIDQEKISIFGTSAKYISATEKAKLHPSQTHDLSTLRCILSTGSPLLPANYDYVYQKIKSKVRLSSISGGTDIVSCFALGNPILPVYRGELQCRGLGLNVEIFNEQGKPVKQEKGELVCTAPFPAMPIYFWNDPDGLKYQQAYFDKFPGVWAHGDYAELTAHDGLIIYGRSDALLKPAGVRIGTAEIYRQVEKMPEVTESLVIGQEWNDDVRIILFVKLQDGLLLNQSLKDEIKTTIRQNASPHHVPSKIIQVPDLPKTLSGKIVELAVRDVVHGHVVKNKEALANPEALDYFKDLAELQN